MRVTVVVPTFNEAGNVRPLADALLALPLPGLRVLFVDDASPDGTGQAADGIAASSAGRVEVLHRTGRRGLGLAYVEGLRLALDEGAEAVVQMDADLSHDPADVPRLLGKLADNDLAQGSRYVAGGRIDNTWGVRRLVLSRSANAYARTILGLATRDVTGGFRAWRRSALESVDVGRIRSNGYLFLVEMIYLSERLGLRIAEVPIYFADRRVGDSKMSLKVKLEAAAGIVAVWRRHHRARPAG
ncbi:MAG TPA: polyprenol monophosphomannose synthase [Terriglobales bacterium]|nr:polyprenol monophosphomannose synthase [Terriglobales bacterium]